MAPAARTSATGARTSATGARTSATGARAARASAIGAPFARRPGVSMRHGLSCRAPMAIVERIRGAIPRPQRARGSVAAKHDAELRWWLTHWDPVLRAGGFNPGDASRFLDGEPVEPTYLGRRWQQARAEVRRIIEEAALDGPGFFEGKVVVDVGPGPLGSRTPARPASASASTRSRSAFVSTGCCCRTHRRSTCPPAPSASPS